MAAQAEAAAERSNYVHLVWDIAWFGLGLTALTRFGSIFAIHLGANAVQIGLLTALPALILLFSSAASRWWLQRFANKSRAQFWAGLFFRLNFLLPAFAPLLPPRWQPIWLILALTIPAIPQGPAGVIFITLMREGVSEGKMPKLISMRTLALNIGLAISAVAYGLWLEHATYPYNYIVMFLTAFAFSLISLKHCGLVRVAPVVPQVRQKTSSMFRVWRERRFQRVAFVGGVMHIAFLSVNSMIPLYLVNNLGATEGFIAVFGLVELFAGATMALFTTRLVRWLGYRTLIAVMMAGTALSAIVLAFAHTLPITLIGGAISGACWSAAAMVGLFGFYNEQAPKDNTEDYNIGYQQMIGLSSFIGPLLGSLLAGAGVALPIVLLIGAVLRLFAAPLIDDPHVVERQIRRMLFAHSKT